MVKYYCQTQYSICILVVFVCLGGGVSHFIAYCKFLTNSTDVKLKPCHRLIIAWVKHKSVGEKKSNFDGMVPLIMFVLSYVVVWSIFFFFTKQEKKNDPKTAFVKFLDLYVGAILPYIICSFCYLHVQIYHLVFFLLLNFLFIVHLSLLFYSMLFWLLFAPSFGIWISCIVWYTYCLFFIVKFNYRSNCCSIWNCFVLWIGFHRPFIFCGQFSAAQ